MSAMLTPEQFENFFEFYRQEQHQVSGVWTLYSQLKSAAPALLDDGADWIRKYRAKPPVALANPLAVPYFSQRDNDQSPSRTCFSSSCAMLLAFIKPGSISSDDDYIETVFRLGDTTEAHTQVAALRHYGVQSTFIQNGSKATIIAQIDKGIPVPCGWLHKGPASSPSGGGHWSTVIGYTDTGVIVHDPWGECDLLSGTYSSTKGGKLTYSDRNWTNSRWMADGPGTGWCIVAQKP